MIHEQDYHGLLRRSLLALAGCLAVVVVCYFWIDRPTAFYVHDHEIEKIRVFKWLTYPPPTIQTWSPLVLALLMVRRAFGTFSRWQELLVVACLSLIVADEFRTSLGDLCGRYWPETWFHNTPSLLGDGTYGFHPFKAGDDIGSFPSGHAARILGFASVGGLRCRDTV
jgi:membrane-associated phospholipid phosphatase